MVVYRVPVRDKHYDLADLGERSIAEDQIRRDFTINSIAVELGDLFRGAEGAIELVDASNGVRDLEARLIRVNSRNVYKDDPLRIVRLFRFESQLQFAPTSDSLDAVPEFVKGLDDIAGERVRDELFHILRRNRASETLAKMDRTGVLARLFPILDELKGVTQNEYHHLDVFTHSLDSISQFEYLMEFRDEIMLAFKPQLSRMLQDEIVTDRPRFALMKLALLFHDIAKPRTRAVRADGKVTFIGHDKLGAELTEQYLDYLHMSRREKSYILALIEGHLRPGFLDPAGPSLASSIFRYFDQFDEWGVDLVVMSIADRLAARGEKVGEEIFKKHYRISKILLDAYFNKNKIFVRPPDIIDGNELMRELDLTPGRRVGILLKVIKEGQASGAVTDRRSAIEYARQFIEKSSEQEGK
jgi:putative nucleotidyltransferase with HDIG domain